MVHMRRRPARGDMALRALHGVKRMAGRFQAAMAGPAISQATMGYLRRLPTGRRMALRTLHGIKRMASRFDAGVAAAAIGRARVIE